MVYNMHKMNIVQSKTDRRGFLGSSFLALAGASLAGCRCFTEPCGGAKRRYALNPPTVKGYNLSFKRQVELAIAAGFDGMEPWLKDMHAAKVSGEFADAVKTAKDAGFEFVNGIAFGSWAVNDPAQRAAGLEETKRDMALLAEAGCPCVAASMFGAQKQGYPVLSLETIAERYAAVCDLGREMGVRPLLEYWGHSVNLHTPEDALWVASHVGRSNAGVLADVYHTYRGGGRFESYRFFTPAILPVLHMNDYPATPAAAKLTDADRVWPGDGIAPWKDIFANLDEAGANPWLSVELFNPNYWKTDALDTMKTAVKKMKGLERNQHS